MVHNNSDLRSPHIKIYIHENLSDGMKRILAQTPATALWENVAIATLQIPPNTRHINIYCPGGGEEI